ncbi:MAG: hypothetical protein K5660_05650 [Paludibacteraceae bacterium]|nr:hypothetical protein [Paludibacteraceae bacterium]
MKKLLISALSCLMMVSVFSSCEKKQNDGPDSTKKYFNIECSNVEDLSAQVTVTPTDMSLTYLFGVMQSADFNSDTITSRLTKEFFDAMLKSYEKVYNQKFYYADLLRIGKTELTFDDLEPQTEYTAFAVALDTVSFKLVTSVETVAFKTLELTIRGKKEITFDELEYVDNLQKGGWWQIFGDSPLKDNQFYYITVSPVKTNKAEGTYTLEDMDLDYTFLRRYTLNGNDTMVEQIPFIAGAFELKETTEGANLEATVVGKDGYQYTIHATGIFSSDEMEIIGEKELVFTDIDFVNAVETEGWWQIMGDSKAVNNQFVFISVSPVYTETVTGSYTMEDMDETFTLLAYYTINGNDTIVDAYVDFVEGEFNVTETETGATMEAVAIGNDGYQYTIKTTAILQEREENAPARRRVTVSRRKAAGLKKAKFQKL